MNSPAISPRILQRFSRNFPNIGIFLGFPPKFTGFQKEFLKKLLRDSSRNFSRISFLEKLLQELPEYTSRIFLRFLPKFTEILKEFLQKLLQDTSRIFLRIPPGFPCWKNSLRHFYRNSLGIIAFFFFLKKKTSENFTLHLLTIFCRNFYSNP